VASPPLILFPSSLSLTNRESLLRLRSSHSQRRRYQLPILLSPTSSRASPSMCSTPPYFWSSSSSSRTFLIAGVPSSVVGALPPVVGRSSVVAPSPPRVVAGSPPPSWFVTVASPPRVISVADWKLLCSGFSTVDGGNQLVQLEFYGDCAAVEVAGSFNGWNYRFKLDPQPLTSVVDF
ncbi:hypothetical protein PIB30_106874, partial [Stylosanthes scabra]|nr:hypothetical protein [Stylosanthes scabra]